MNKVKVNNHSWAYYDENLDKARDLAPAHCKLCVEIESGTGYDHQDNKILIAKCYKNPDGIPDDPKECLDLLPKMCVKCENLADCHMLEHPEIDSDEIEFCEELHRQLKVNNTMRKQIDNIDKTVQAIIRRQENV